MWKGSESISEEGMQASLLFPMSFSTEVVKALKCTELPSLLSASSKGTFPANPEKLTPGERLNAKENLLLLRFLLQSHTPIKNATWELSVPISMGTEPNTCRIVVMALCILCKFPEISSLPRVLTFTPTFRALLRIIIKDQSAAWRSV